MTLFASFSLIAFPCLEVRRISSKQLVQWFALARFSLLVESIILMHYITAVGESHSAAAAAAAAASLAAFADSCSARLCSLKA